MSLIPVFTLTIRNLRPAAGQPKQHKHYVCARNRPAARRAFAAWAADMQGARDGVEYAITGTVPCYTDPLLGDDRIPPINSNAF